MLLLLLFRWQSSWPIFLKPNLIQLRGLALQNLGIRALPKKGIVKSGAQDSSDEGTTSVEKPKSSKRAPRRSKKVASETLVDKDVLQVVSDVASNERTVEMVSDVDSKQVQRKSRKKGKKPTFFFCLLYLLPFSASVLVGRNHTRSQILRGAPSWFPRPLI